MTIETVQVLAAHTQPNGYFTKLALAKFEGKALHFYDISFSDAEEQERKITIYTTLGKFKLALFYYNHIKNIASLNDALGLKRALTGGTLLAGTHLTYDGIQKAATEELLSLNTNVIDIKTSENKLIQRDGAICNEIPLSISKDL